MKYDFIMIHYGELSTKGANRRLFIQQLLHNVRVAIKGYGLESKGARDHIYIDVSKLDDISPVISRLQEVSGIQRITPVMKSGREIAEIKESALSLLSELRPKTFKVETKRADKTYPLDSYEISRQVGGFLAAKLEGTEVDVHNPEAAVRINLREDACYLSLQEYPGIGGYPLGMNGKVTMLLSGGIDSPVAAYALIRRGIKVECLHFASPPYTSDAVLDKLADLLKTLNAYQSDIRLDIVPFTKLQEEIYRHVDEPYCITVMRRMMVRIAVGVSKKNKALAIATGESIGQVASQTLESLSVINEVTNYPILRPLAASDKVEIINTAKRIGTFEISIRPYEDCCTIFKPKRPKTRPSLKDCEYYESKFDWQKLVDECIENARPIYFSEGQQVQSNVETKKDETLPE